MLRGKKIRESGGEWRRNTGISGKPPRIGKEKAGCVLAADGAK
jgi:hypothetical protein